MLYICRNMSEKNLPFYGNFFRHEQKFNSTFLFGWSFFFCLFFFTLHWGCARYYTDFIQFSVFTAKKCTEHCFSWKRKTVQWCNIQPFASKIINSLKIFCSTIQFLQWNQNKMEFIIMVKSAQSWIRPTKSDFIQMKWAYVLIYCIRVLWRFEHTNDMTEQRIASIALNCHKQIRRFEIDARTRNTTLRFIDCIEHIGGICKCQGGLFISSSTKYIN